MVADAFFLGYGGLGWGFDEVKRLSLKQRRLFVKALENQLDYEKREADKARR